MTFVDSHNLDDIARDFGVTDQIKVLNIGKSLESKGLIHTAFTMTTNAARISGDGALFVEQGGQTGVIEAFGANLAGF